MGYADMRKGFDLFLSLWRSLRAKSRSGRRAARALLLGGRHGPAAGGLARDRAGGRPGDRHLPSGRLPDRRRGAFCPPPMPSSLTSREDPFPSVVLEALSAGTPVVAFDRSGGIPDMLRETGFGSVVPHGDVDAMARAVADAGRGSPARRRRALSSRSRPIRPSTSRPMCSTCCAWRCPDCRRSRWPCPTTTTRASWPIAWARSSGSPIRSTR